MSQTHLEALRQIITSTPADDRLKEVRHTLACWPEVEGKEAGLEAVKETLGARLGRCTCPPGLPVCRCGRRAEFARLHAGALKASADEVERNRRSRSARLRAYERLPGDGKNDG